MIRNMITNIKEFVMKYRLSDKYQTYWTGVILHLIWLIFAVSLIFTLNRYQIIYIGLSLFIILSGFISLIQWGRTWIISSNLEMIISKILMMISGIVSILLRKTNYSDIIFTIFVYVQITEALIGVFDDLRLYDFYEEIIFPISLFVLGIIMVIVALIISLPILFKVFVIGVSIFLMIISLQWHLILGWYFYDTP